MMYSKASGNVGGGSDTQATNSDKTNKGMSFIGQN